MAATLTYYYTNGAAYFSDAALTIPTSAPSSVYADFANDGKLSTGSAWVNWAVLSNGIYDVGFIIDPPNSGKAAEPSSGGAIGYISYQGGPNLISAHDGGRLLQPSWWAKPAAGDPAYITSRGFWNPATGVGRVESIDFAGGVATFTITPYNFNGSTLVASPATATVVQRVSFDATGHLLLLHWDFTYTGASQRIGFWANAPCIYSPSADVSEFASYRGPAPWTNDALTSVHVLSIPGGFDRQVQPTEDWGALVDGSNYGIGLMSSVEETMFKTTWYVGGGWDVDLVMVPDLCPAPGLTTASQVMSGDQTEEAMALAVLTPGATYSFGSVVTVGSTSDIRSRFYAYRAAAAPVSVEPPSAAFGFAALAPSLDLWVTPPSAAFDFAAEAPTIAFEVTPTIRTPPAASFDLTAGVPLAFIEYPGQLDVKIRGESRRLKTYDASRRTWRVIPLHVWNGQVFR